MMDRSVEWSLLRNGDSFSATRDIYKDHGCLAALDDSNKTSVDEHTRSVTAQETTKADERA